MANLKAIAELVWQQLWPRPGDETAVPKDALVSDAKTQYAYQMLLLYWSSRNTEGEFEIPSHLLTEIKMDVVDNEMDISKLKVFRSLPSDIWLQNVGGLNCSCSYVRSSVNMTQLMCGDDSLGDAKTYIPLSKKIKFPEGVHETPLTIIYANMGEEVDDVIEVDDALGAIVRDKLLDMYAGKVGQENKTNDSNTNE